MSDLIRHALEGAYYTGIGIMAYGALFTVLYEIQAFTKQIKTQEELNHVVEEEAQKFGRKKPITAKLHSYGIGQSQKTDEGYRIDVGGGFANRRIVKHELVHIYRDCDSVPDSGVAKFFKFYFVSEPRASLYGALGIKL